MGVGLSAKIQPYERCWTNGTGNAQFLLSYAYAKSIDQGSNIGEQLNPINLRQSRAISAWDLKHVFVGSYTPALPIDTLLRKSNRLTDGWSFSGTTRFTTGLPVTLFDNTDNSLLGTLGNGANNYLLDTPQFLPGPLKINKNGATAARHLTRPCSRRKLSASWETPSAEILWTRNREFRYDASKTLRLTEAKSIEFRAEAFNVFNHAQFYGAASVDGQREDPGFGRIESAAAPRLMQIAGKFTF
jgi:hypothetical protein